MKLYHYTRRTAACAAIQNGLATAVTPGDPLQVPGIWLSPNIYGPGSLGSYFGAVGLEVDPPTTAAYVPTYLGFNPRYPKRHRFLFQLPGARLPTGVLAAPLGSGQSLPSLAATPNTSVEILFPDPIAEVNLCGVRFGDHAGHDEEHSSFEHQCVLAMLLSLDHRLLAGTDRPHSTEGSPDGAWWVFEKLRRRVVNLASVSGAPVSPKDVSDLMGSFALYGEMNVRKEAPPFEAKALHLAITEAYAAAFGKHANVSLDLSSDIPFEG